MGNTAIKTIVLDVLIPHLPSLPDFSVYLEGVEEVNIILFEMDARTQSLKVVINGSSIDYEALQERMGKQGAVIHSVDQVIVKRKNNG